MISKTSRALILKHVPNEDAGTILSFLDKQRIPHETVDLYADGALPSSMDEVGSLIIMGGPMNVDEEEKYPFLKKEKIFLKETVLQKKPCLGICLGAQLLAKLLGARVFKATAPEIGWDDVISTEQGLADPYFSALSSGRLKVLQWHEDTFDLPENAVLLASSKLVPHQAFRYEKHVYGLQFHVEVNEPMLKDWFKKSAELSKILAEYEEYREKLSSLTDNFYKKFFAVSPKEEQ